uniref:ZP domain-containing protein n=1 Tax=Ditylenchus dipsaci TaxID=166011 RepID=A0A915EDJ2_9BILA
MLPTTELIDTAKMPLCTYSVRRGSVNGPIVTYATVGEPVFHVWHCDSDMFSMLVHNCFVDDGAGKDRKPLIDEHGCTIDPVIVSDLTYNNQANLAYSEVNVFKFADKITTYFQCAVSTCMVSEGMCTGKTPPRCGINNRKRRTILGRLVPDTNESKADVSKSRDDYVMDLSAEKIVVLDLDDSAAATKGTTPKHNGQGKYTNSKTSAYTTGSRLTESIPYAESSVSRSKSTNSQSSLNIEGRIEEFRDYYLSERVCFSYYVISLLTCLVAFSLMSALAVVAILSGGSAVQKINFNCRISSNKTSAAN